MRDDDLLSEREGVPSGSVEENLVGLCEREGEEGKGGRRKSV